MPPTHSSGLCLTRRGTSRSSDCQPWTGKTGNWIRSLSVPGTPFPRTCPQPGARGHACDRSPETFGFDDAGALLYGDEAICRHVTYLLDSSAGPADFEPGAAVRTKPEVYPAVADGEESGLRHDRLCLNLLAVVTGHLRSNSNTVTLSGDRPYFEPVIVSIDIVPQQRRGFVQVHN